jgi:hypothetical protein
MGDGVNVAVNDTGGHVFVGMLIPAVVTAVFCRVGGTGVNVFVATLAPRLQAEDVTANKETIKNINPLRFVMVLFLSSEKGRDC